jgi:DivIVA domain-containing protein
MDFDDPERRIAELERQLAEARRAGNPPGGGLTPQQVHDVAFNKPPIGMRGYNEDEVDKFLDLVEAALPDPTGRTLTAQQVREVLFSKPPIGKRGYSEDEVDAFLDLVAAQLQSGAPPPSGSPGLQPPPTGRSHGRDTSPESKGRRFLNGVVGIVRSITD